MTRDSRVVGLVLLVCFGFFLAGLVVDHYLVAPYEYVSEPIPESHYHFNYVNETNIYLNELVFFNLTVKLDYYAMWYPNETFPTRHYFPFNFSQEGLYLISIARYNNTAGVIVPDVMIADIIQTYGEWYWWSWSWEDTYHWHIDYCQVNASIYFDTRFYLVQSWWVDLWNGY